MILSSSAKPDTYPLPEAVSRVLAEFHSVYERDVRLWHRIPGQSWSLLESTTPADRSEPGPDAVGVAGGADGEFWLEAVGCGGAEVQFLASVISRMLTHDQEARFLGNELAERYEEITLLYTISEILGSVISLEQAASIILSEVVSVLRVKRAALWVHNPTLEQLELVAAVGGEGQQGPVAVDDEGSVTSRVFRERTPMILDAGDEFPRPGRRIKDPRNSLLSVPVSYSPPEGDTRTIGVINLIGRGPGDSFSAGDQKLITAIASQIGAAVENSRLVANSLRQERIDRELELAHHLQLKLLPPLDQFDGYAEVAARCLPADSVGGDFYHLFRLPGGRIGVMIGDVSSHGFGAALIMALTMSAVAIHASEGDSPGEVLRRTHLALIDELESTEMYLTLFYGVIDPEQGEICYVNAGHSHAFRLTGDGRAIRLGATSPPFGMVDLESYTEAKAEWTPGEDVLFLFTDGLSDALGEGEAEGERVMVDEALRTRDRRPREILTRLFEIRGRSTDIPPDDRTAILVRI